MLIALGLVVIYVVFVWLVFFRFKLMKFTIVWGVVGFWVGVHMFLIFIVALRFFQPYSMDGHVIRPTIQLIPRLPEPTLLEEVLVVANQPVAKGDVLYQFDKTLYLDRVREQEANLVLAQQNAKILDVDVQQAMETPSYYPSSGTSGIGNGHARGSCF